MPMDRFFIGPYNNTSGLQNDVKPWLIPDEAWSTLENAYVYLGKIRKRFGTRWLGDSPLLTQFRLNMADYGIPLTGGAGVGITNGGGDATGTVPGLVFQLGQRFIIGVETDEVTSALAGAQPMTRTGGSSTTHTFNIGTGAYNFVGAPATTQIFFYPNPLATDAAGTMQGYVPSQALPTVGSKFSISGVTFTVSALGTPTTLLVANGSATAATVNTTTGQFNLQGVRDSDGNLLTSIVVYYYPGLPVMGLLTFEQTSVNDEFIIGFDTSFAYQYTDGWQRLAHELTPGAASWSGDNSQFFWSCTYSGAEAFDKVFYVTNFNETEPNFMRYFFSGSWNNFRPQIDTTPNYMNSAAMLVPFKNHLIAINTWEGTGTTGENYPNRIRWSQLGSPLDANAWRQDLPGRGNAIDAPILQAAITCEFINDRLIINFERSTWALRYTGNQVYPFTLEQINPEFGAESRFSIIPIDRFTLSVGNVGIVSCNGSAVTRIDEKIPTLVFEVHHENNDVRRVYGIRDYYLEVVYWTFPDAQASGTEPYPSKVLVYNYIDGTWAINDDTITCFGYFQPTTGITWDSTTVTWDSDVIWDSGNIQAKFRQVVGGNQQGYTFICDGDENATAAVLTIANLTVTDNIVTITSPSHNLDSDDFIYLQSITGTGNLTLLNNAIFQIISSSDNPVTQDSFSFIYDGGQVLAGTYSGAGLMAQVPRINMISKEFNFYAKEGKNAYINKVDYMVDTTSSGQIQTNFYVSTSQIDMTQAGLDTNMIIGTGVLDTFAYTAANGVPVPLEEGSTRVWHPVYYFAEGQVVQLQIILNDVQMRNTAIRLSDFELHAIIIYAQPTGRLS